MKSALKPLLTLCVIQSLIIETTSIKPLLLTPYIKKNRTEEARETSFVNPQYFLNLTSHSGFLTVDEKYDSNIFFWYFPVPDKPVNETAWIIWLQGGPGGSSLIGLFDEIGPIQYSSDQKLKLREWSWANDYSLLFIDNPVGTGFSFTDNDEAYARSMETYSAHLASVLKQFLQIFPELKQAPLYIAGESYAGRYVPGLAMDVLLSKDSDINLQGLILGNPVLNRKSIVDLSSAFYNWGLIDSQGVVAAKSLQDSYSLAVANNDYASAYQLRDQLLDKLQDIAFKGQVYNVFKDYPTTQIYGFSSYVTRPEVREALHVGDIDYGSKKDKVVKALISDFLNEVTMFDTLLDHYRILIYCGQTDLISPCVPNAEERRKNWFWSHRDEFLKAPRVPWWYNETVAGYVKTGGGFTEAQVNGAGHLAPIDKPAEVFQLVSYFIRDLDTPLPPNYQPDPNNTPEYSPSDAKSVGAQSQSNAGLIVSVVINCLLVLCIVLGVLYYLRWKRKYAFLYNSQESFSF